MRGRRRRDKELNRAVRRGALIGAGIAGAIGMTYGVRSGANKMKLLWPQAGRVGRVIGAVDGAIQSGLSSGRVAAGGIAGSTIAGGIYQVRSGMKRRRRRRYRRRIVRRVLRARDIR